MLNEVWVVVDDALEAVDGVGADDAVADDAQRGADDRDGEEEDDEDADGDVDEGAVAGVDEEPVRRNGDNLSCQQPIP